MAPPQRQPHCTPSTAKHHKSTINYLRYPTPHSVPFARPSRHLCIDKPPGTINQLQEHHAPRTQANRMLELERVGRSNVLVQLPKVLGPIMYSNLGSAISSFEMRKSEGIRLGKPPRLNTFEKHTSLSLPRGLWSSCSVAT